MAVVEPGFLWSLGEMQHNINNPFGRVPTPKMALAPHVE
jgi:hypothetical protein